MNFLFRKSSELGVEAKKRIEKDNEAIYEKINNLEYIKAVSGETYEKKKLFQRLDDTFRLNTEALLYRVLFEAVPNYVFIPNVPVSFIFLVLLLGPALMAGGINDPVFIAGHFTLYYFTALKLNSEINKLVDGITRLDELTNSLLVVKRSIAILNRPSPLALPAAAIYPWENGDITFEKVVFAYPQRTYQTILQNFSFCFQQGKSYGIAGRNGIGKSTITKTLLKLYPLQSGQILVNERNIQKIDTTSLHERICYQTNRPGFSRLTIAENVFYPHSYQEEDLNKLITAAQAVGIWEFIQQLPHQFHTLLEEGGREFSEGQKQQIAAMRIFVRDYDVYILDEILSNIHPMLKKTMLHNIFARIKGKTVIVIDHHYEIFQYLDYVYQFTAILREGRRSTDCKLLLAGKKKMTVPVEKATTNYVPAVAVRRRWRTLSGIIGRKGAGEVNGTPGGAVKCVDIGKNTKGAKAVNYSGPDIEARKRGEQNGLDTPLRLGSTLARVKLKGIDGDSHKHWSMWFNPTLRVEPYQGRCFGKRREIEWRLSGILGAAWPSSVRAVRRKERMTSGRHGPYALGDTHATMAATRLHEAGIASNRQSAMWR
ncbi:16700_t:CDS:2 [Cetraspora pellucida]|uniref:16700_t:CDS:1 n=1 Tax=Cetraspora pellucida TaxID=1433469 RepID=A0A9N9D0V8_9GLOM|nr:16700_t:CDS:2 [Cetraspora pellucida]